VTSVGATQDVADLADVARDDEDDALALEVGGERLACAPR
jgi:hypothetical protein